MNSRYHRTEDGLRSCRHCRLLLTRSRTRLSRFILLLVFIVTLLGCQRNVCNLTSDGSVWLSVARLSRAAEIFHKLHGRYGELTEMTNLLDGFPPSVTGGRVGSHNHDQAVQQRLHASSQS